MPEQTRTFSEDDRLHYGGDYAITRTVPKFHPRLHIPLPGTRASIEGSADHVRTFYRGDIINRESPSSEFNFCLWKKDGSELSRSSWLFLTVRKGFKPCKSEDWEMSPELLSLDNNPSPYEVEDGLIVLRGGVAVLGHGAQQQYEILMWRTKERMLAEEAKLQVAPMRPGERSTGNSGIAEPSIANALGRESGISAMPTQIEEIPHMYQGEL